MGMEDVKSGAFVLRFLEVCSAACSSEGSLTARCWRGAAGTISVRRAMAPQ